MNVQPPKSMENCGYLWWVSPQESEQEIWPGSGPAGGLSLAVIPGRINDVYSVYPYIKCLASHPVEYLFLVENAVGQVSSCVLVWSFLDHEYTLRGVLSPIQVFVSMIKSLGDLEISSLSTFFTSPLECQKPPKDALWWLMHACSSSSQGRWVPESHHKKHIIHQRPTSWAAGGAFAANCGSAWSNFCWLGASFGSGSSWAPGGSWVSLGFKRSLPKDISTIVPLRYLRYPKVLENVVQHLWELNTAAVLGLLHGWLLCDWVSEDVLLGAFKTRPWAKGWDLVLVLGDPKDFI